VERHCVSFALDCVLGYGESVTMCQNITGESRIKEARVAGCRSRKKFTEDSAKVYSITPDIFVS